jgi:hypothetical protein
MKLYHCSIRPLVKQPCSAKVKRETMANETLPLFRSLSEMKQVKRP